MSISTIVICIILSVFLSALTTTTVAFLHFKTICKYGDNLLLEFKKSLGIVMKRKYQQEDVKHENKR